MIQASRPLAAGESGTSLLPWVITPGPPCRVDDFGRKQHLVPVDLLAQHEGLDAAICAAGLVMAHTIPLAGEVFLVFVDTRPAEVEPIPPQITPVPARVAPPAKKTPKRRGAARARVGASRA